MKKAGVPSATIGKRRRRMERFMRRWDKVLFAAAVLAVIAAGVALFLVGGRKNLTPLVVLRSPTQDVSLSNPAVDSRKTAWKRDLDLNEDGHLDKAEVRKNFALFDSNGNGKVDEEEMVAVKEALAHTSERRRFRMEDSNGDGQVDADELYRSLRGADKDRDGTLSAEEQRAYFEQFDVTLEAGAFR